MNFLQKVANARDLIKQSIDKYPKITVGCSFGKDSIILLHLCMSVKPDVPVFALLANTEFPETYAFAQEMVIQYHLNYKEYIFEQIPGKKCCGDPKVLMAEKALESYDAWISGVRNTEGITRANFKPVEELGGLVKINPILEFTEIDVWRYIALHKISMNPMYAKGYRSLGCSLCSAPEVEETESEREGRWKGTEYARGECGIHTHNLRKTLVI